MQLALACVMIVIYVLLTGDGTNLSLLEHVVGLGVAAYSIYTTGEWCKSHDNNYPDLNLRKDQ